MVRQSGAASIFTERGNHGNTSLFDSASAKENRFETKIMLEAARDFFVDKLLNFDHLVLKSDLQGMDALVLAEMPIEIWSKIDRAVVEIWALPEVHRQDVEKVV